MCANWPQGCNKFFLYVSGSSIWFCKKLTISWGFFLHLLSNFNLGMKSVWNPVLHIRRQAWQSGILIFYQDATTKVLIRALILHYIVRFRDINIWKFSGTDCQAWLDERNSAELGSIQFRKDPLRLVIITMTLHFDGFSLQKFMSPF